MTHCREEGRAAHCLLWRTHDLMNPKDLQKEPFSITTGKRWKRTHVYVSVQVRLFEGVNSCCKALRKKCLTLTCSTYSFHSEGSARLHKESFVLQHMRLICSRTSTTADARMVIEGKLLLESPAETSGPKILQNTAARTAWQCNWILLEQFVAIHRSNTRQKADPDAKTTQP